MDKKDNKNVPTSQWTFTNDEHGTTTGAVNLPATNKSQKTVSWVVKESVFQGKSLGWYLLLAVATLVFAAIVYLLTRDKITTVAIIVAALFLGYYAGQRPKVMEYKIDGSSFFIGNRNYSLTNFRSFFMVDEEKSINIILMPLKRFSPALTVYAALKDSEKVINALSQYLPLDKNHEDMVDRFMRRIHF